MTTIDLCMTDVPGGTISLRDERTKTNSTVSVADFELMRYPVTLDVWRELHASDDGSDEPARLPVTDVSWNDAVAFCNALSETRGLRPCYRGLGDPQAHGVRCDWDASGYRLPTEAEWEHACRAGSTDSRYGPLDEIAWHRGNSEGRVHEVGLKAPNRWGLHDTIGNVWEWCWDVYDARVYGPYRAFRGGGWCDVPRGCRASCRRRSHPTFRIDDLGFRLARSISTASV